MIKRKNKKFVILMKKNVAFQNHQNCSVPGSDPAPISVPPSTLNVAGPSVSHHHTLADPSGFTFQPPLPRPTHVPPVIVVGSKKRRYVCTCIGRPCRHIENQLIPHIIRK